MPHRPWLRVLASLGLAATFGLAALPASAAPDDESGGDTILTKVTTDPTWAPGKDYTITVEATAQKPGLRWGVFLEVPARILPRWGYTVTGQGPSDGPDFTHGRLSDDGKTYWLGSAFTLRNTVSSTTITFTAQAKDGPAVAAALITVRVSTPNDPDKANNTATTPVAIERAGALSGLVMHDVDRNDWLSPGDKPLRGATVMLFAVGTPPKPVGRPLVTRNDGRYEFAHLTDGTYRIQVLPPTDESGWTFSKPDKANDLDDFDMTPDSGGGTASAEVTINGGYTRMNAGLQRPITPSPSPSPSVSPSVSPSPSAGAPVPAPTPTSGDATPTTAPTSPDGGPLPTTGSSLTGVVGAGAALLLLGGAALLLARRRRTAD